MRKDSQYKSSLFTSVIVGAVGAFIFWAAFSGWFSSGELDTQLANPSAAIEEGS